LGGVHIVLAGVVVDPGLASGLPPFCLDRGGVGKERAKVGRVPNTLRKIVAKNIRECRIKKFPGRGGATQCAKALGILPQQWSLWEVGDRMPDEIRMQEIADFFGVTVEHLRKDRTSGTASTQKKAVSTIATQQSAAMKKLLQQSQKTVDLLLSIQAEALEGKRCCKEASALMRQTEHYIAFLLGQNRDTG
jgi:transcriptional regulator with XRE-family HTH domain